MFSEFLLLTSQQHADVQTKCTLIKKSCKKKFFQRQIKPAIRKSSNWGDFLKRLEQTYPVYETDVSVRTEIVELSPLPEFPIAARIRKFKQAFTVDCFDDIVLFVPLLSLAASCCSSGFSKEISIDEVNQKFKYPQCKQGTTGSNPQHEGLQSKEIVYQQRKLTITTDL